MLGAAVFPARAGMIPQGVETTILKLRIPRESGDDPEPRRRTAGHGMYSPRERG